MFTSVGVSGLVGVAWHPPPPTIEAPLPPLPPPHLGPAAVVVVVVGGRGPLVARYTPTHPTCLAFYPLSLPPALPPSLHPSPPQGSLSTCECLLPPLTTISTTITPRILLPPAGVGEEEKGCVEVQAAPPTALRSPSPAPPLCPAHTLAPPTPAETTSYMLLCLIQNSSDLQGKRLKERNYEGRREEGTRRRRKGKVGVREGWVWGDGRMGGRW